MKMGHTSVGGERLEAGVTIGAAAEPADRNLTKGRLGDDAHCLATRRSACTVTCGGARAGNGRFSPHPALARYEQLRTAARPPPLTTWAPTISTTSTAPASGGAPFIRRSDSVTPLPSRPPRSEPASDRCIFERTGVDQLEFADVLEPPTNVRTVSTRQLGILLRWAQVAISAQLCLALHWTIIGQVCSGRLLSLPPRS